MNRNVHEAKSMRKRKRNSGGANRACVCVCESFMGTYGDYAYGSGFWEFSFVSLLDLRDGVFRCIGGEMGRHRRRDKRRNRRRRRKVMLTLVARRLAVRKKGKGTK